MAIQASRMAKSGTTSGRTTTVALEAGTVAHHLTATAVIADVARKSSLSSYFPHLRLRIYIQSHLDVTTLSLGASHPIVGNLRATDRSGFQILFTDVCEIIAT